MSRGTSPEGAGPTQGAEKRTQWRPRPWLAHGVALLLRGGPITLGAAAGWASTRLLPRPSGWTWIAWFLAIAFVSNAVVRLADRYARRLVPLTALLRFSLAFPDNAPSRFAVALRAGNIERLRKKSTERPSIELPQEVDEAATTALAMVTMLNRHDRGTRGHSERVRAYAEMLAEEMSLSKEFRDRLRWGALLHDMGKLSVPAEILNKAGRPTEEEWLILQGHPAEGERILAPLAEWLGDAVHAAGQHHERWDGKGYPRGLAGNEISLSARIVAVADAFAVMTAARAYKKPLPLAVAREELTRSAGTQFDPLVVRAMLNVSVGKVSRAAGPLSSLGVAPGLSSLVNAAPAIPAMVSSGAAAVALSLGLATPGSPLEWAAPVAAVTEAGSNTTVTTIPATPVALALATSEATTPTPSTTELARTVPSEALDFEGPSGLIVPTTPEAVPTSTTPTVPSTPPSRVPPASLATTTIADSPIVTTTLVVPTNETKPPFVATTTVPSETKPPRQPPLATTTTSSSPPAETTPPATVPNETKPPKQPPLATTTTGAPSAETTPPATTTVPPDTKAPPTTVANGGKPWITPPPTVTLPPTPVDN
jgi:HD domain